VPHLRHALMIILAQVDGEIVENMWGECNAVAHLETRLGLQRTLHDALAPPLAANRRARG